MLSSEQIIGNITAQQQWLAAQKQYMQYENSGYNPYAAYQAGAGPRPAYLPPAAAAPPPPPNIAYSPVAAPGVIGAGLVPQVAFPNLGSAIGAATGGTNPSLQTLGYMYPLAAQQQIPGLAYQQMAGVSNFVGGVGATMANFALVSKLGLLARGAKTFGYGLAAMGGLGTEYGASAGFINKALVSGGGFLRGLGELPGIAKNIFMNPLDVGKWAPAAGRLAGGLGMAGLGAGAIAAEFALYSLPGKLIGAIGAAEQADIGTYQTVNKFLGDTILGENTPTGRGITMTTAHDITAALYPKGYKFFTNQMDVMKGMTAALETGLAKAGVSNADELKKKLVKLSDMAYKVAEAMTTSVESATKIISRWRELGLTVYDIQDVEKFSKNLKNMAVAGGVNVGTMQHLISQGSQLGRQFGLYGGLSGLGVGGGESVTMAALRSGAISEQLYRELNGGSNGPGLATRLAMPLGRFVQSGLGQALAGALASGVDIDAAINMSTQQQLDITMNNISREGPKKFFINKKNRASNLFKELAEDPYRVYVLARRLALQQYGDTDDDSVKIILMTIFQYDVDSAEAIIRMGHMHSKIKRQMLLSKITNESKFEIGEELTKHSISGVWRSLKKDIGSVLYRNISEPITNKLSEWSTSIGDVFSNAIYGVALTREKNRMLNSQNIYNAILSNNSLGYTPKDNKFNFDMAMGDRTNLHYIHQSYWESLKDTASTIFGKYAPAIIGGAIEYASSNPQTITGSSPFATQQLVESGEIKPTEESIGFTAAMKQIWKEYTQKPLTVTGASLQSNFGNAYLTTEESILKPGTKAYKATLNRAQQELAAGVDRKIIGNKYRHLLQLSDINNLINSTAGETVLTRINMINESLQKSVGEETAKQISAHLNLTQEGFNKWLSTSGLNNEQMAQAKIAYNAAAHTQHVATVQGVVGDEAMKVILANKRTMPVSETMIKSVVNSINPYLSDFFNTQQKEALTTAMLGKDKADLAGYTDVLKKMGIDTSKMSMEKIKEAAMDYVGQAILQNEKYEQKKAMENLNALATVVDDITKRLEKVLGAMGE